MVDINVTQILHHFQLVSHYNNIQFIWHWSGRGELGSVTAEALKWEGGHALQGKGAYPSPVFGVQEYHPGKFLKTQVTCLSVCAIWCILELKIDTFKHQNQLVNYHLAAAQTSANYLVLYLIGEQCNIKCTTHAFNLDFMQSIWWHQMVKSGTENPHFAVPLLKVGWTRQPLCWVPTAKPCCSRFFQKHALHVHQPTHPVQCHSTEWTWGVKYTYGTPTKFPQLFHLQQASPELPLHPFDGSRVLLWYFICQLLITAYVLGP